MIRLGEEVRDKITGFAGVATARSEFENGCIRYLVTSRELKDGKVVDDWFDEQRLEAKSEVPAERQDARRPQVGGPGPNPPSRDPTSAPQPT